MTARTAISPLDRVWSAVWSATVVGPFDGVDADHLHRRYAELLAHLPRPSWLARYPGPFAHDVEVDPLPMALALLGAPWSGHPLRAFVHDGVVALLYSHGIGDGQVSRRLVADLIAPTGTPMTVPALRAPGRGQTARAAARQWVSPRRVGTVVHRMRARSAPVPGPTGMLRPVVIVRSLDTDDLTRLREVRATKHPTVSTSTLLLTTVVGELAHAGVPVEQTQVAVDTRRYLRGDARKPDIAYGGNLTAILDVPTTADPEVAAHHLTAALTCGQPFAQYLLSRARVRLHPGRPSRTLADSRVVLNWSDRGQVAEWTDLPWRPDAPRTVVGATVPVGRRINVNLTRHDDGLHLAAAVNRSEFDEAVIAGAIDAALDRLVGARR